MEFPFAAVHTVVLHRQPDLEALTMAWLIARSAHLRMLLAIPPSGPRFKFIPAGSLRAEDWPDEREITALALESQGYCFIDCGGGGATFDQHGHAVNRGQAQDTESSIEILARLTRLCETEPYYTPLVQLVGENDRTGRGICPATVLDRSSTFPDVPRDLRTLVGALNGREPDESAQVAETFFLALDGMQALFNQLARDTRAATGLAPHFSQVSLRDCYFLTVDLAAIGIERVHGRVAVECFWDAVNRAWQWRAADWQKARADYAAAQRVRGAYQYPQDGPKVVVRFMAVHSDARSLSAYARLKGAEFCLQLFSSGHFMLTRKGEGFDLDYVAGYLRMADAWKRGGRIIEPRNYRERGTVSVVEAEGQRMSQFLYPAGGFAFGNRFSASLGSFPVSPLTRQELIKIIQLALKRAPLCAVEGMLARLNPGSGTVNLAQATRGAVAPRYPEKQVAT